MNTLEGSKQSEIYTARQIGRALGKKRQAMQRLLCGVEPGGQVVVNGALAGAWTISALPIQVQEQLTREAQRLGYRNSEHLLSAPAGRWEPLIPLGEVAQHCLDKAAKLQRALARSLALQDDPASLPKDRERAGLEDYRRHCGGEIKPRHLRRLIKRTLDRDGGAGQLSRLELYLDERPARKAAAKPTISLAVQSEFRELQEVVATLGILPGPRTRRRNIFGCGQWSCSRKRQSSGRPTGGSSARWSTFLARNAPFLAGRAERAARYVQPEIRPLGQERPRGAGAGRRSQR